MSKLTKPSRGRGRPLGSAWDKMQAGDVVTVPFTKGASSYCAAMAWSKRHTAGRVFSGKRDGDSYHITRTI